MIFPSFPMAAIVLLILTTSFISAHEVEELGTGRKLALRGLLVPAVRGLLVSNPEASAESPPLLQSSETHESSDASMELRVATPPTESSNNNDQSVCGSSSSSSGIILLIDVEIVIIICLAIAVITFAVLAHQYRRRRCERQFERDLEENDNASDKSVKTGVTSSDDDDYDDDDDRSSVV
jgi:hypothetical protein